MVRPLRVALVGCGKMAVTHAASCLAMPEVHLVALADIRPEALEALGTQFDIPAESRFTDYVVMYEKIQPDIVVVSTRTLQHHAPTVAALERGIHVLCEKPMAASLAEADEMIAVSERTGAKLGINTQRHTDPYYRHAVQMVRDGLVGDLRAVRCESKHGPSGFSMMDRGSHFFDAMRMFAGDGEWVFAHVTNEDGTEITERNVEGGWLDLGPVAGESCITLVRFRNGVNGVYEFWRGVGEYGFEVLGTKGILRVAQEETVVLFSPGGRWGVASVAWEPIEVPLTDEEKAAFAVRRWSTIGIMRGLIKGIQEDTVPACSGYDGRAALEMIMGSYLSQKTGARVGLPLTERRHPLSPWS